MTREERRRLLGDTTVAEIHARVSEAPPAPPELIDALRRILTRPASRPRRSIASSQRAA